MSSYILCKILSFRRAQIPWDRSSRYALSIFSQNSCFCRSIRNCITCANEKNIIKKDYVIAKAAKPSRTKYFLSNKRHPIISNSVQPIAKWNRLVKLIKVRPALTIFVLSSSVYSTKDASLVLLLVDT